MESSYFREKARFSLAGKWGVAILASFLAALLGGLVGGSGFSLNIDEDLLAKLPLAVQTILGYVVSAGVVLGIIQFVVGGPVELGYSRFLLNLLEGKEAKVEDVFSQFHRFGDGFCLRLLRNIFTALWTLLFIIPGIVAEYSYSMANFILLENPGMGANEALKASKELMRGHKWELFCLRLSFFGWSLLSALTLGIGDLWLNAYKNAAEAAFYRELVAQPRIEAE